MSQTAFLFSQSLQFIHKHKILRTLHAKFFLLSIFKCELVCDIQITGAWSFVTLCFFLLANGQQLQKQVHQ